MSDSDEIDNADKKALGQRLRALRDGLNWTLAELSQATKQIDPLSEGISTVSITRYENAYSYPGYREIKLFAQAFGTSITFLFYGDSPDPYAGWEFSLDEYLREEIRDVLRAEGLIEGESRQQRERKKTDALRAINRLRQPFLYANEDAAAKTQRKKAALDKLSKTASQIDLEHQQNSKHVNISK